MQPQLARGRMSAMHLDNPLAFAGCEGLRKAVARSPRSWQGQWQRRRSGVVRVSRCSLQSAAAIPSRLAQRAAQMANSKVGEIVQRLGIEEPWSHHLAKKGNEIRTQMVGTAESVYNSTLAISSRPVVRRSIIGFLLFYAFSVIWAARILFFDKKSEEARERFGRELRLQKLREGGVSASSIARVPPLNSTDIQGNGRKVVPSASDEGFLEKVRKIQEMARAVRVSEQEVFSPSESAFVTGPIPESEKTQQQSSSPSDLRKNKKLRKQHSPLEIQDDGPAGLRNRVFSTKAEDSVDGNEHAYEPEPPSAKAGPLGTPSAVEAEAATKNMYNTAETSQSQQVSAIDALDSIAARSSNSDAAPFPLKSHVVPSLNGSSKPHRNGSAKDGKPPPPSSISKAPSSNGNNVTPSFNGTARSVTPLASRPQTFKSMRVITSPEEARARIAARKAKDGSSSANTSSSSRPKFPRINVPDVELVGSDSNQSIDQAGSMEKDKGNVRGVDSSQSSSARERKQEQEQEPESSAEQEEEDEAWMRDEVLRTIVLKVRDNEDAGRESFHGLDSKEEQRFFQGLEHKFDREGEAVKNWIQARVENLDYGLGGVGVDDPPERFVARWKDDDDPERAERAKRFAKFQDDRKGILEKQMGTSTSASPPSPTSPSPASSEPAQSTSRHSSPPTKDRRKTDEEAKERLQSNGNASGSKTVVTSSGRQAKPVAREWQHTKKWAQDLQRKYDLEPDSEKRALIDEMGQDLDRWITEDEIAEASRLLSQGLPGEQEYVRMHYEKTKEKIQKQHEMFGSEGMLNKYAEYKEPKKEPELWWLDLPYVLCIGLTTSAENGNSNAGFYSLDMTPDFAGMLEGPTSTCNHTVAFQDQKDALNFCGLLLSEQYSADVIPIAPKDLYVDAKQQGFKVTVIKKGQLGLSPGQALDDVEQRLIDIGSSVYWEELERARSIDIDAVLDEGLGYGRPSR